jgi:hypothetical protein
LYVVEQTGALGGIVSISRNRSPLHETDYSIVHDPNVPLDAESHEYAFKSADGASRTPTPINRSTLPSKQAYNLCTVRTKSLHSIERSLVRSSSTVSRRQDGPPRSSDINATTVNDTRGITYDEDGRHVGCLSFIRRGSRRRAEPSSVPKITAGGALVLSAPGHACDTCDTDTYVPENTIVVEDDESADRCSELSRSTRAYKCLCQDARIRIPTSDQEMNKQKFVNRLTPDVSPRDYRPLDHADTMPTVSSGVDGTQPLRIPYDMRFGAVQPQYFYSGETLVYSQLSSTNRSLRRHISSGSSPSLVRSGSTLSTSPPTIRKPLVDLTPQYLPPPQHRHKGHGYRSERLGSGKLIDYATSPRTDSGIASATDWRHSGESSDLFER